jgi:hypothetical protein
MRNINFPTAILRCPNVKHGHLKDGHHTLSR